MDVTEIIVTVGGMLLIGLTLWFFFGKRGAGSAEGANR